MRRRLTVSPVPVMWRPNTSEWALRGRLGAVAARGLRQEPGARSFSGDGRHQRSRGSRAMIREAFLPKKSHPASSLWSNTPSTGWAARCTIRSCSLRRLISPTAQSAP